MRAVCGFVVLGIAKATVMRDAVPTSNDTGAWPHEPVQVRLNVFDQPTRLLSVRQLLKVLDLCCKKHPVRIANFGAGEYLPDARNKTYTLDPVNEILRHARRGRALLVDPNRERLHRATRELPPERVVALAEFATPETVDDQLRRAQLGREPK